jgi:hypothetical protein
MNAPKLSTYSTEHLEYLLRKTGKTPLYWNYTIEEIEIELQRRKQEQRDP